MSGISVAARAAFLLFALAAGQQQQQIPAREKVDVAVYYETLCPDSKSFIVHQLAPAYARFSPYMNLTLVPFGKANSQSSSDGTVQFACQHGPVECHGNKMQSCALSLITDQDKQEQFVSCVMSNYNPIAAGQRCAKNIGLNYGDVEYCMAGDEGIALQLQAQADTFNVQRPLDFVPTIVYNNVFDQDKQDDSLFDFQGVLCSELPNVCTLQPVS